MPRPRALFRDFGLALALCGAAGLIYWRTTLPAQAKSREIELRMQEQLEARDQVQAEVDQLKALENGKDDPETIERLQRRHSGGHGLPGNEHRLDPPADH